MDWLNHFVELLFFVVMFGVFVNSIYKNAQEERKLLYFIELLMIPFLFLGIIISFLFLFGYESETKIETHYKIKPISKEVWYGESPNKYKDTIFIYKKKEEIKWI